MQYRIDPKSSNRISALGLGCMRIPGFAIGKPDPRTTRDIIERAIERGINYLDTAYLYPGNEVAVGTALARDGLRDRVFVATKLPHASCKRTEDFDRFFSEQLRRLRTDHIDYYLLHNITSPAQWERVRELGIEDWIARKKACGAIRSIGFSFHGSTDDFPVLLDAYDWDFCQIQYNYANERYQAGTVGLHAAAARGMAVFVMEPLLGGRLADKLPAPAARLLAQAGEDGLQTPGLELGVEPSRGDHAAVRHDLARDGRRERGGCRARPSEHNDRGAARDDSARGRAVRAGESRAVHRVQLLYALPARHQHPRVLRGVQREFRPWVVRRHAAVLHGERGANVIAALGEQLRVVRGLRSPLPAAYRHSGAHGRCPP